MWNIAINTWREIIRNRIFYFIIFFALFFIIISLFLSRFTIAGEDSKIMVDFGLAMIEIFGIIGVIFVGSQLVFKEIDGKTIFLLLSKPIERKDFIIGKFIGFSMVLALIVFLQSFFYLAVLLFKGIPLEPMVFISIFFIFLKLEIFLSIIIFLSTFMSNILTILTGIMIYVVAHSINSIIDMINIAGGKVLVYIGKILQVVFPPFEAINIKDYIGTFMSFDLSYFLLNGLYSLLYILLMIVFSIIIFNKKSFE